MGSIHKTLLFHTEVWWLSGRKSICVTEFQTEPDTFFIECDIYFKEQLTDKIWLYKLRYLADVFIKLNKCTLILNFQAKIRIFDIYINHNELNSLKINMCLMRFLVMSKYVTFFDIL